ncbi:hypothetical protein FHX75_14423 [Micromonospora palomenae]|uniref:Uncharacterized protein n=1 Tax=Micromonospora palomenae TaxID=1461247 RepID=A0A561VKF1_9ACTN|nr:hypothetical protein [Micromonospora palomenae]TWG12092.1 hypothetical protein FHX75_14423 [Micromonospora palomenae]
MAVTPSTDTGVAPGSIAVAAPAGVARLVQALRRWDYEVRSAAGSPQVGYLAEAE